MIKLKDSPVEWAGLIDELQDCKEHLKSPINEMNDNGEIESEDYRIQIDHLYAHLNRAWNSRNATFDELKNNLEKCTEFPTDYRNMRIINYTSFKTALV